MLTSVFSHVDSEVESISGLEPAFCAFLPVGRLETEKHMIISLIGDGKCMSLLTRTFMYIS